MFGLKWPAFLLMPFREADDFQIERAPWLHVLESHVDTRSGGSPYVHRDAARAWAGFAMWCMCWRVQRVHQCGECGNQWTVLDGRDTGPCEQCAIGLLA